MKRRVSGGWLKLRRVVIPVCLTILLAYILFAPVVKSPGGGSMSSCDSHGCTYNIEQYESISYAYGGWGAYFQTGVNDFVVTGWMCYLVPCVPQYYGVVWSVVLVLLIADVLSFLVIARRWSSATKLPTPQAS
jgi:hypothetical protein